VPTEPGFADWVKNERVDSKRPEGGVAAAGALRKSQTNEPPAPAP